MNLRKTSIQMCFSKNTFHVGRAVAAVCVLALLAGCVGPLKGLNRFNPFAKRQEYSIESAMERGKPARLEKYAPAVDIRRVWSRKIGRGLGKKYLQISPAIVDDRIIVADAYGLVMALDSTIWKSPLENSSGST